MKNYSNHHLRLICGMALLLLLFTQPIYSSSRSVEHVYAVRAGTIVSAAGDTVKNGIILIRNGLIEAVGTGVAVPVDAEIIEADTMFVYPGFIDAHTSLALKRPAQAEQQERTPTARGREPEGPGPVLFEPEKMALAMLDPEDAGIAKMREAGITSALTVPQRGIFVGQSCLINLSGEQDLKMALRSPVALHIGWDGQRNAYPATLMAVIAYQRQTFLDAKYYQIHWERYNKSPLGMQRPEMNPSLEALGPVLEGKLPVIIQANTENEIKRAIQLGREFGLKSIISGAVEGYRVLPDLKNAGYPVIVSVDFPSPERVTGYVYALETDWPPKETVKDTAVRKNNEKEADKKKESEEDKEKAFLYENAGKLFREGLNISFTSGGLSRPGDFLANVRKTVEHGLPKSEALKALTIHPARLLGAAEMLGSIEPGKIANLVISDSDIFSEKSKIMYVFVDGKKTEIEHRKPGAKPEVDVTGQWNISISSPMGNVTGTLTLNQQGADVTGKMVSDMGSLDIQGGMVSGDVFSFAIEFSMSNQPVEILFSGTVEGNRMSGTVHMGAMGSADWQAEKPGSSGMFSELLLRNRRSE